MDILDAEVEQVEDPYFAKIASVFRLCLVAPSGSGKSVLVLNLLKQRQFIFSKPFDRIIFCYPVNDRSEHRAQYLSKLRDVCDFIEIETGLVSLKNLESTAKNTLYIVDDLQSSFIGHSESLELCTVGSHHYSINIIFICQCISLKQSSNHTNLFQNFTHFCIWENRTDVTALSGLSRYFFGLGCSQALQAIIEFSKENFPEDKYPQILVNCSIHCPSLHQGKAFLRWLPDESKEYLPICFTKSSFVKH